MDIKKLIKVSVPFSVFRILTGTVSVTFRLRSRDPDDDKFIIYAIDTRLY